MGAGEAVGVALDCLLREREEVLLVIGVAVPDHCFASKFAAVHCFIGSNIAVGLADSDHLLQ